MKLRFRLITLLGAVALVALGGALYLRFFVSPAKREAEKLFTELSRQFPRGGPPPPSGAFLNHFDLLLHSSYGPAYLARLDDQSAHVAFDPRTRTVYYIYLRPEPKPVRYGLNTDSWNPSTGENYGASTGHTPQITLHEVRVDGDRVAVEFSFEETFPGWGVETGTRYEAWFPSGPVHLTFDALLQNARKKP